MSGLKLAMAAVAVLGLAACSNNPWNDDLNGAAGAGGAGAGEKPRRGRQRRLRRTAPPA